MAKLDDIIKFLYNDIAFKKVLEIGCGEGKLSYGIKNIANEINAIDIEEVRLDEKIIDDINFIKCDARKPPFIDNTFDVIIAYNAAYHFKNDLESVILESLRILKNGGKLIFISTWKLDYNVILKDIPNICLKYNLNNKSMDKPFIMTIITK